MRDRSPHDATAPIYQYRRSLASPFRSDDANNGNSGHQFVQAEIQLGRPPHMNTDKPTVGELKELTDGTPRYEPAK